MYSNQIGLQIFSGLYNPFLKTFLQKHFQLHPDNASDLDEAEAARRQKEFVELNKAYETLRRASTRKEYDAVLGEEYNHIHINVHNYGRNATEWHQFR